MGLMGFSDQVFCLPKAQWRLPENRTGPPADRASRRLHLTFFDQVISLMPRSVLWAKPKDLNPAWAG